MTQANRRLADSDYRLTVYADKDIPLAHRETLAEAQDIAETMPAARYIVMRLRAYPFTHFHRLPLRWFGRGPAVAASPVPPPDKETT